MANLNSSDIKTFIGSKNFEESRDFYVALGWKLNFENSMLHITIEDAEAWYKHVTAVLEVRSYGAARVRPPKEQDYGALVTFVWDPVGVLLHFAQPLVIHKSQH